MPEIAEVARIVHHLRKSIVGKTLAVVTAQDDANVFGKVGTIAAEFQKSLTGKKVIDAGQQGKYFWLIMSSPPHPVFHFGMTGWFYIRGDPTMHYRPKGPQEPEEWPPRFWKFSLETKESPIVEAAFTDARRFARIRLVDCAAEDIRKTTPMKENGPDPVIDKDLFTLEWFMTKLKSKHVPVKALLLDQANISGIGNWVGDEVLYHSKLHPEQYSDTFSSEQLKQLHTSILYVCQTAVDLLADSSKFPDDWLFNHRWGKGKKDAPTSLPTGEKITFLKVGGRTSCVVPSVQKKTGAVAGDLKGEDKDDVKSEKKPATKKRKAGLKEESEEAQDPKTVNQQKGRGKSETVKKEEDSDEGEIIEKAKKSGRSKRTKINKVVIVSEEEAEEVSRKKPESISVKKQSTTKATMNKSEDASDGRRRSGRNTKT